MMEDKDIPFYIYANGTRLGPLSRDAVLENIKDGRVKPDDYIWDNAKEQWINFTDCDIFGRHLSAKKECEDLNANDGLIICPKCKVVNKNCAIYCKECGSKLEGHINNGYKAVGPSIVAEEPEKRLSTNVEDDNYQGILTRLAREGNSQAQFELGAMYYGGNGVEQDYGKAIFWLRKAAENGDTEAQHVLGEIYTGGKRVTQDFIEAINWYHKAAEKGFAPAQNNLGNAYTNGRGVVTSYSEAFNLYQKAAFQNYPLAQHNLASCYEEGRGVGQDTVSAYMWFSLAAAQGDEDSAESRDELVKIMSSGQVAEGQRRAREWLEAFRKGDGFVKEPEKGLSPPSPSWLFNILSFAVPIIGIILGIVFLMKDNAACKESGRLFLLAGIGGSVLYFLCFACIIMGAVSN